MINNISNMDVRPQMAIAKPMASVQGMGMPPILGFKTPQLKEKAKIQVKKVKRGDNLLIPGIIDDDYVDVVEEYVTIKNDNKQQENFFAAPINNPIKIKRKMKYLKNCYLIDFIQSPKPRCGLGTEAIKNLAEKAMFDTRAQGRIVTYSVPMIKEMSPALFFYKLGFRFTSPEANQYMEECITQKMPDIPAQTGMMFLPKANLHKLLRYGEMF